MRVDVMTKEYPPEIYGGAGVHVAELVWVLREMDHCDFGYPGGLVVRVRAFGR